MPGVFEQKPVPVGVQTALTEHFDSGRKAEIRVASLKERRTDSRELTMLGCVYVTGGYRYSKGTDLPNMEK